MQDTLSDLLTRIRNAQKAKILNLKVAASKLNMKVLDVLISEGYIESYKEHKNDIHEKATVNKKRPLSADAFIDVALKYDYEGNPVIKEIHRVSKPSKRIYAKVDKIRMGYYNNLGTLILSTSHGVCSDQKARELNVGGEVLCKVF